MVDAINKLKDSHHALSLRDKIIVDLRQKLNNSSIANDELKGLLNLRNDELGRASHDMEAMSRESKTVCNNNCHIQHFVIAYFHK